MRAAERSEITERLSRAPLFSDLPQITLASIAPSASLKVAECGVILGEEGRRSPCTALVVAGTVHETQRKQRKGCKQITDKSEFPFVCEDCLLSQVVTGGYRWSQVVTGGYRWLQVVTEDCILSQVVTAWSQSGPSCYRWCRWLQS